MYFTPQSYNFFFLNILFIQSRPITVYFTYFNLEIFDIWILEKKII